MASRYKSIESQAITLYRLDFYKNKKNWKLYQDLRTKPSASPEFTRKHNNTYNVSKEFSELDFDTELLNAHNKAFLEDKPASHLELKPAEDPLDLHLEYLTPAQIRQTAEDWLTQHGIPVQQECADKYEEYGSMDESADFVRGAHQVPHSSELDLTTTKAECQCTFKSSLCVLSKRQLAHAIRRHHSALTMLLREQALRETLNSRSLLQPPISFEDHPTRDPGLQPAPDRSSSRSSRVMSAGRVADTGRGRGRGLLQQHRVFGIGKGNTCRFEE